MKLPLSLIKSFLHIDQPVARIAETLTLLGIEVDQIENEHPSYSGVVVGEIRSVKPHPKGEKLQIAEVSDRSRIYTVVCAAPNCRAGIKVPFAKTGALLTDRDGLQRKIEKTAIRGVESEGMLCSASELHLFEEAEGILELPKEMETGRDLVSLLWDPVFELSLTPNLGHCMSALGIARELSASLQIPLLRPKTALRENPKDPIEEKVKVEVEDFRHCPRYMCRLIEGVKIGPSPFWLQKILELCGIKPINNVIDAAHLIMIKYGQPFHAFDFDTIEGRKVKVSTLKKKESFSGLDGQIREIPPGTLVISDAHRTVAIAGILGGSATAISHETSNILLEAACFDPMMIRIGAKKIGVRTESSQRFEKGVDPVGVKEALDEAAALIQQLCGSAVAKGVLDEKKRLSPKEIRCRETRVNQILGTKLSLSEIEEIFRRLHFETKVLEPGLLLVEVPLYRTDLSEEIDLIEEVARIYGYNNIEKKSPRTIISSIPHDPAFLFEKKLRFHLLAQGLQEFLTCDLISPKLASLAQEIASPQISMLQALYAKSEEYSILRNTLLPGLLEVVKGNIDQKNLTLHAFEIGRIHFLQQEKPVELPMAALLLTGKASPHHWSEKSGDVDFFDLKGLLESLFQSLHIQGVSIEPSNHHLSFHPGRQADLLLNGLRIGSFGEVHPSLLEKFDIKQRVYYAELNLQTLIALPSPPIRMVPLSQFPSSERDWTLPLPLELPIGTVFKAIHSHASSLLEKTELLDLYIPENRSQKNVTFRFTYRDPLKTISYEEVEAEHSKLLFEVAKLFPLSR